MEPKQTFIQNLSNWYKNLGRESYIREATTIPSVSPDNLVVALHKLESNQGTSPNTPPNTARSYNIPAANGNEKDRAINYQTGYGGEFGITPKGIASIAKSKIDRNSIPTKYGYLLTPGQDTNQIQRNLLNGTTTAGRTARDIFMLNKASSTDMTPSTLANDYMENYVTPGSPNYTDENRNRALRMFNSLAQ